MRPLKSLFLRTSPANPSSGPTTPYNVPSAKTLPVAWFGQEGKINENNAESEIPPVALVREEGKINENDPETNIKIAINSYIKEIVRPEIDNLISHNLNVEIEKLVDKDKIIGGISEYVKKKNLEKDIGNEQIVKMVDDRYEDITTQIRNYAAFRLPNRPNSIRMRSSNQLAPVSAGTTITTSTTGMSSRMRGLNSYVVAIFGDKGSNVNNIIKDLKNALNPALNNQFTRVSRKLFETLSAVHNVRFIPLLNKILTDNKICKVSRNDIGSSLIKISTQPKKLDIKYVESAVEDNLKHMLPKVTTIGQLLYIMKDAGEDSVEFNKAIQDIKKDLTPELITRLMDEILSSSEGNPQYNAIEVIFL
ncbi:MAG: hypothetical protein KBD37_02370 [Burkholderiales bacterium]|nr:hypothetical protein [Burkholderiales bacterium]